MQVFIEKVKVATLHINPKNLLFLPLFLGLNRTMAEASRILCIRNTYILKPRII